MRSRRRNSIEDYPLAAPVGFGDEQKIASTSRDQGVSGFRGSRSVPTGLPSASGSTMGTAPGTNALSQSIERSLEMDKDRVDGAAKTVGGNVKEAVGKLTGDQKTVAEGHAEQKVGEVQNAVGGMKDTVRDIQKAK